MKVVYHLGAYTAWWFVYFYALPEMLFHEAQLQYLPMSNKTYAANCERLAFHTFLSPHQCLLAQAQPSIFNESHKVWMGFKGCKRLIHYLLSDVALTPLKRSPLNVKPFLLHSWYSYNVPDTYLNQYHTNAASLILHG